MNKMTRLWLLLSLILTALGALSSSAVRGQSSVTYTLELPGDKVAVRYSPGSLDRAVSLQERLELLVEDFRSWSKAKSALVVLLLSRDDWQNSGFLQPYGIPEAAGGRGIAVAAWGDDDTAQLFKQLLGTRLPTVPDQPWRGTPEHAASLAVGDLIAEVEAARLLLTGAGIVGDQPWVDGVMAQMVALSVIQGHDAARLVDARLVFGTLSKHAGGPGSYPLSSSASPPSLESRLWFDSQYFAAADLVAGAAGKQPAKALLKQARKNGGRVTAASLLGRYPELDSWLKSSFASE